MFVELFIFVLMIFIIFFFSYSCLFDSCLFLLTTNLSNPNLLYILASLSMEFYHQENQEIYWIHQLRPLFLFLCLFMFVFSFIHVCCWYFIHVYFYFIRVCFVFFLLLLKCWYSVFWSFNANNTPIQKHLVLYMFVCLLFIRVL